MSFKHLSVQTTLLETLTHTTISNGLHTDLGHDFKKGSALGVKPRKHK